ncbi:MAG: nuclear transport factor 2 family protein [Bryobacteraceae bacterium]
MLPDFLQILMCESRQKLAADYSSAQVLKFGIAGTQRHILILIKNSIKGMLAAVLALTAARLSAQHAGEKLVMLSQKDAESVVQQFEAEYVDAYNRKDLKAVAALFTENGVEFGEFGAVTQGRQQIEKTLATVFALPTKWETEDTPKDVLVVANDVIVTQGAAVRTPTDDSSRTPQTILYTKVLTRQNGQWQLAAVQYASPPSRYVGKGPAKKRQ